MENSEGKHKRDIPITILLSVLATACCAGYLFVSWRYPSMGWVAIGLCFGVVYLVTLVLHKGFARDRRSFPQILLLVGGGGWFAYLSSEYLLKDRKVSAAFFAVVAIAGALRAAWVLSGMVVRSNQSSAVTQLSDPKT